MSKAQAKGRPGAQPQGLNKRAKELYGLAAEAPPAPAEPAALTVQAAPAPPGAYDPYASGAQQITLFGQPYTRRMPMPLEAKRALNYLYACFGQLASESQKVFRRLTKKLFGHAVDDLEAIKPEAQCNQ